MDGVCTARRAGSGQHDGGLNAENGNRKGGDDGVTVSFQVAAVRLKASDEQVGAGLLCGLAKCFGNIAAADENAGVGAHFCLEVRHVGGRVAHEFLLPLRIHEVAAGSPGLDASGDMGEGQASVEFAGQLNGPGNSLAGMSPKIDCAEDAAYRKFLRGRILEVAGGPDRAIGGVKDFGGHSAEKELIEGETVGGHHDQVGLFAVGGLHNRVRRVAIGQLCANRKATEIRLKELVIVFARYFEDFVEHVPTGGNVTNSGNTGGTTAGRDDVEHDNL